MDITDELAEISYPHWEIALEGNIYVMGNDYLYKSSEVIKGKGKADLLPKRAVLKYKDTNIVFVTFLGRNDKYLGFVLRNQSPLTAIVQASHVLLADNGSTPHIKLESIVDLPQVKLVRASSGGDVGFSYWISTKRRDTIL